MDRVNSAEVCRLCLSEKDLEQDIFSENDLFQTKIKLCISIQVSKEDCLPHMICKWCAMQLNTSFQFRQECQRADDILRRVTHFFPNSKTKNAEVPDGSETKKITEPENQKKISGPDICEVDNSESSAKMVSEVDLSNRDPLEIGFTDLSNDNVLETDKKSCSGNVTQTISTTTKKVISNDEDSSDIAIVDVIGITAKDDRTGFTNAEKKKDRNDPCDKSASNLISLEKNNSDNFNLTQSRKRNKTFILDAMRNNISNKLSGKSNEKVTLPLDMECDEESGNENEGNDGFNLLKRKSESSNRCGRKISDITMNLVPVVKIEQPEFDKDEITVQTKTSPKAGKQTELVSHTTVATKQNENQWITYNNITSLSMNYLLVSSPTGLLAFTPVIEPGRTFPIQNSIQGGSVPIKPKQQESEKVKCNFCNKTFACKNNLLSHMIVHRNLQHYKCQVCDKWFSCHSVLKRHLSGHITNLE